MGNSLCRAAFVAYMKKENEHREPWAKPSMLAHRKGTKYGFDHPGVQLKFIDFKAGWEAAKQGGQQ